MQRYKKEFEIRWADLDPNYHVLHSRYYDFGAYCRMSFFVENGLTPELLTRYNIGPILFREECVFKKEIRFGDKMSIDLIPGDHTENYSRWSISHNVYKEGIIAAILKVEGAWMDTEKRKLATPPPEISDIMRKMNF